MFKFMTNKWNYYIRKQGSPRTGGIHHQKTCTKPRKKSKKLILVSWSNP